MVYLSLIVQELVHHAILDVVLARERQWNLELDHTRYLSLIVQEFVPHVLLSKHVEDKC